MSQTKRNSPPASARAPSRRWSRPGRSAASSAAVSARDRDGSGRSATANRVGSQASSSAASPANRRMLPMSCGFDLREDLRHAVDVGLAADEAGRGESSALPRQDARRRRSRSRADESSAAGSKISRASAGASRRCRAQDAAADDRSARPGAALSLWPLRRPKKARSLSPRSGSDCALRLIAASGTADGAAARAARARRHRAARNGCARPCRRRRARRASRCGRGEIAVRAAAGVRCRPARSRSPRRASSHVRTARRRHCPSRKADG